MKIFNLQHNSSIDLIQLQSMSNNFHRNKNNNCYCHHQTSHLHRGKYFQLNTFRSCNSYDTKYIDCFVFPCNVNKNNGMIHKIKYSRYRNNWFCRGMLMLNYHINGLINFLNSMINIHFLQYQSKIDKYNGTSRKRLNYYLSSNNHRHKYNFRCEDFWKL